MSRYTRMTIPLCLLAMLLAGPGCIFSPDNDDDNGGGGEDKYAWPSSKFIVLDNFQLAYDGMDYDAYVDMLHEDYKFTYLERDEDGVVTDVVGVYTFEDERSVAEKMFSGEPGWDPVEEDIVAGISDISIILFDLKNWLDVPPDDIYFGDFENAQRVWTDVHVVFTYNNGAATFTVESGQVFVVAPIMVEHDGVATEKWVILGQQDEGTF